MNIEELIYLDHAAATPMSDAVIAAMQPYMQEYFYNPSSPYAPAVYVRRAVEDARHRAAIAIGAQPADSIFTAGATESINLAMTVATNAHVVTTAIEHDAVLAAARQYDHTIVAVGDHGLINIDMIVNVIRDDTTLVSIGLANNELGVIQPLRDIATRISEIRSERLSVGNHTPLWLHTDASQGAGQLDLSVARLGVDMMTLNAGKMYGPKQVGLLWRRAGVQIQPIVYGGGQEMGLRSGTENVAGIIGFAEALERAQKSRTSEAKRLSQLRDQLQAQLQTHFADMIVTTGRKKRLAGHLHVAFPGLDAERLVFRLETRGVLVATGSACAANKNTRSHVLVALRLDDAVCDGSLRLTLGKLSTPESIARAGEIIIQEVAAEYARIR